MVERKGTDTDGPDLFEAVAGGDLAEARDRAEQRMTALLRELEVRLQK